MEGREVPVFTPPTPEQRWALHLAASYLNRAGTAAATALLDPAGPAGDGALAAALRDQLLAGAALCDGLLDLARDEE